MSQCEDGKPANLQDEFAALLVKGRFDQPTAQLFRSLQRNNSDFDSQNLQNVRIAAELSSAGRFATQTSNFSRNSFRGSFNNYRGGYFGNQRGRGYYPQRDIFQNLRGASYPRFRPPFEPAGQKHIEEN